MAYPKKCQQGGWLLLELLVAWSVSILIVTAALGFFAASYSQLLSVMEAWNRVGTYEKWMLWMHDALDDGLALERCGMGDYPRVTADKQSRERLVLHACQWVDQRWQWLDSQYYIKSKKGVSYLYEKITGKQAVAWIPGIRQLQVYIMKDARIKQEAHLVKVNLTEESEFQVIGIQSQFVFSWHD